MADTFDITDTRHEIKPCPKCQASTGIGLVTRKGLLAMECGYPDFDVESRFSCQPFVNDKFQ
jgi:hypothetical protein